MFHVMNSAGIRRRYYILTGSFTMAASLIWGVNTLFLLDAGLDMFQVFGVNAVFTAAMTLFEIPTGAVADSRGRRISLIWSSVFLFIGTLGYLAAGTWGGGVPAFVAASLVLGLGFTFFSGAAEAWAVDELAAVGDQGSITSLFANAATAASVTMLGGTILGGFLGSVDYRMPYLMRAALFLVMLGLSLFAMPEKGWRPDGETLSALTRIRRTARDSMEFGFRSKVLRRLMSVSFFLGVFMMLGFYALQPYITDLAGFPGAAWLSGLVTAVLTLSQVGGQTLARKSGAASKVGGHLAGAMAVSALGALLTGLAGLGMTAEVLVFPGPPLLALAGMILMMGGLGYAGPFQRTALHGRVPSDKRATVISLESLVSSGGAIVGQPGLGWIARKWSIAAGYFVGAGLFLVTQPLLALFRRSEEEEERASVVSSTQTTHQGPER